MLSERQLPEIVRVSRRSSGGDLSAQIGGLIRYLAGGSGGGALIEQSGSAVGQAGQILRIEFRAGLKGDAEGDEGKTAVFAPRSPRGRWEAGSGRRWEL